MYLYCMPVTFPALEKNLRVHLEILDSKNGVQAIWLLQDMIIVKGHLIPCLLNSY